MSLRTRITLIASILSGVLLVSASALLVFQLEYVLTTSSDRVSRVRLHQVASQVRTHSAPTQLHGMGDGLVQVVAGDGRVIAASPNLRGRSAIASFGKAAASPTLRIIKAPDETESEMYRVWALRIDGSQGST